MAKPSVLLESFEPRGCSYGECCLFVVSNTFSELCTQLFNAEFRLFAPCRSPFLQLSQIFLIHFAIPLTLGVSKIAHHNINKVANILRAPSWFTARFFFLPLRLLPPPPPPPHHHHHHHHHWISRLHRHLSSYHLRLYRTKIQHFDHLHWTTKTNNY